MATTASGFSAVSGTLTSSAVDTAILSKPTAKFIRVINVTGTAAIYFTVCSPGGPNLQPTVAGANTYAVGAVANQFTDIPFVSPTGVVVNLIASGTPGYTVEVL